MKAKLSIFTRLGNLLLLLSILLQFLFLALLYYVTYHGLGQDPNTQARLGGLINILGLESYMEFGSSLAVAIMFRRLFTEQARGELKKLNGYLITIIIILAIDGSSIFLNLVSGRSLTNQEIIQLILCYFVPLLTAIAISFSSRFLAILSALGRIPATLWDIGVVYGMKGLLGMETVMVMTISELLIGLGIIISLLGVRKPGPQPEEE